jgi:hypothetical protein
MPHSKAKSARPLLVLISGPYSLGTGGDPAAKIGANRARLEEYLPIIAEWLALPMAHRLSERCDAVLRIPGSELP